MDLDDILSGIAIKPITEDDKRFSKPVSLPFKDAGNKWKAPTGDVMDSAVLEEDLKGVIFKRVPIPIPDFETYRTIPSYSYQVKNGRDLDIIISMKFNGNNLRINPGAGFTSADSIVKGVVKAGSSTNVCTCEPENKKVKVFDPFNADIMVFPATPLVKESYLEEVKLTALTTYSHITTFDFEIFNGKSFEIEAELKIIGDFGERVITKRIKSNETVNFGQTQSSGDISHQWKWKNVPVQPKVEIRKLVSEAQGVYLTQNITNESMNANTMEINNTLSHPVIAEIDFVGNAKIDMCGLSRPIALRVPGNSTKEVGTIKFFGEMSVSWSWKGEH